MKFTRCLIPFLLFVLLCGSAPKLSAQLLLFIEPAVQSARPGDTVTFSGTLTNSGADTVFVNGNAYDFAFDGFTLDDSPFLANAPVSLATGESSDVFDFFTVTVPATVQENTYSGAFTVLGGANALAQNPLVTQNFAVNVVPAPSALIGMMLGITPVLFVWSRRRHFCA